ncbi:MAG: lytic transglycosylase domain-containing protein [Bacteroidota bacterium]
MIKYLNLYTLILAAAMTIAFLTAYSNKDKPQLLTDANALPQIVKSPPLDLAFSFAGEPLPMDNFDVRERLDRELTSNSYFHSSTLLNLKKSYKYFPIIEPILAEEGVPDDLKYIAVAESGLANVTSPAGAKGFWQFMKGTATDHGLEVSSEVDERYHLEKATRAACSYLKKLKERHGSWALVAAAYNMGSSRLKKEMEKQSATTYYDLNLSEETMRYVFRIVALKTILENPNQFGFYLGETHRWQPLPPSTEIEIKEGIAHLGKFARRYGTSYRMLKIYNPWLRAAQLTNTQGKTYRIRIPR